MKTNKTFLIIGLMAGALNLHAANVTKLNTTTMNGGAADWSSAPATTDVGEFGSTPSAGTLAAMTLGGPLTLGGLQLDSNLAGPLIITDANALTLGIPGATGINMLTANKNATLNFPLTLGGSQTWSVGAGRTLTVGGIISDSGNAFSLIKTGIGTLTLTNNNTYTGGTANNSGTLNLDFTGGANNDIIANSSALTLGGTLNVIGAASGTSSQTFGSTAFNPGANVINVGNNGNTTALALGGLTVTIGATVNFSSNSVATITTTTLGAAGLGVLGVSNNTNSPAGYATYGLYDWATTDTIGGAAGIPPAQITGLSSIPGGYTAASGSTALQGTPNPGSIHFDITGNVTETGNEGGSTVRFNTPTATTLNENGKWLIVGGFLITPNMVANDAAITGTASWFADYSTGIPQTGVVWQNNTNGFFIINCPVGNGRDNAGSPFAYIQAGPGTVVMGKANTYTRQTFLNGGCTLVTADSGLGAIATAAQVNLNGGTVVGNATFTMENTPGVNKRPFALGSNGGGLAAISGTTMTIDGIVSGTAGTGPLTIGFAGVPSGILPGTGANTAHTTATNATGTVALSGANTYTGGTILQNGTVLINGINNLGGAGTYGGVTFNGGTLQYAPSASGAGSLDLSSGSSLTVAAGGGTLDLNGNTIAYANSIGNNGNGSLTVVNSASGGTLTLSGANTYTGGLIVNSGATVLINGSSSAGTVTINGTLGGIGTIAGNVSLNLGASLTLTNGTPLTVSGSLTLNNNAVTVNVNGSQLTAGVYTLLNAGSISGTPNATPGGNAIAGGFAGTISTSGGNKIILTVVATGVSSTWSASANGNWSASGNWSSGVPQIAGDGATFGIGPAFTVVNLDANKTNGSITFNNNNSFTITNNAHTLTLDNKGNGVGLTVSGGTSNSIQTLVTLNDTVVAAVTTAKTLAVTGAIANGVNGSKTLTVGGGGTLALSGNNSYGPSAGSFGTTLTAGTLQVGSNNALGAGDLNITASSTLQSGAALTGVNNNINIGSGVNATLDSSSTNNLTLNGVISGSGSVTKTSNGIITLGNVNNTYSGGTTINGGFLSLPVDAAAGSPSSLGTVPFSATANNIILNSGGLLGNSTLALNANRGITMNGTGLLDAASGTAFTIGGIIAGNGTGITVNSGAGDTGTVVLNGANTFNGPTFISAGTLSLGNSLALQNSTLIYSNSNGGTLDFGTLTAATLDGLSGTNNLNLTNDAVGAVALTLGNNNATTIYTGILGGSGSLNTVGSGLITIGSGILGGAVYTGATTVNNGTLTLGGVGNILAGNNNIQVTGANGNNCTLNVVDSTVINTTGTILIANGGLGNGTPSAVATLVLKNNTSVSGGSLSFGTGGPRPGDGSSVTVQDNAALMISGTFNLYNGASAGNSTEILNLNGGTTTVGNFLATSGSVGAHQSIINFNGGILKAATNDADNNNATYLPALTGLTVNVTNATLPAVFVNTNGFTNTIAATLANATVNPDAGFIKRGGGTLILSAANTYNGPTTITKGTLLVNGSIGTGSVMVVTNGTLGGFGTINGSVTNQTGTLAPGVGSGGTAGTVLYMNNNLTLLPGSTNVFLVSVNNGNNDNVSVSGAITYGGTLVILTNATDTTPLTVGNTYILFSSGTSIAGSFSAIQPSPGPGLMWINDPSNPGQFDVVTAPTTASFTGTPTNGLAPLQVVFTDTSSATFGSSITSWVWNFGNGNVVTNTSNGNVTNTYAVPGSYTVSLIVTDSSGSSNTNTQTAYIVVQSAQQPPVAGFSGTPRNIFVTQGVVFTNSSTGSFTNSAWSFGNGNVVNLSGVSASNNVNNIYTNAGTYTVSLIVTGAGGASTNTQVNYIVVKPKTTLGKPVLSGGNLIVSGTNGPAGQQYRILSSTNVALPVASWTSVYTNIFASDGSYTYTNTPVTNKASFFKLVSP